MAQLDAYQSGPYDSRGGASGTFQGSTTTLIRSESPRAVAATGSGKVDTTEFVYQVQRSSEEVRHLERQLQEVDELHTIVIGFSLEDFLFLSVREPILTDLTYAIDELCDRLPNLAATLRTLASKVNVLQPKPGGFMITNDELRDAKAQLQGVVCEFESCLRRRIACQAAAEARSKESTRVKMASRIRQTVAERQGLEAGDQYILQMMREAESLQPATSEDGERYRMLWRLENPYTNVMQALEAQPLEFINFVLNYKLLGASLGRVASWRSSLTKPIAYILGSYVKSETSEHSGPTTASLAVAPGTHDYLDEDEDAASLAELKEHPDMTHEWAEDMGSAPQKPIRRRWLVCMVAVALTLVVGAAIAVAVLYALLKKDAELNIE